MHAAPMPLAPDQVHIWWLDPDTLQDPSLLREYHTLLNENEQAKWQRFRFDKDKHQHLVTRALVRDTLSHYHPDIKPQDWQFEHNAHGKPQLPAGSGHGLQFNVSHTQNRIVLAVSRHPLGVDVERIKPVDDIGGLARRCFTRYERQYIFGNADAPEDLSPGNTGAPKEGHKSESRNTGRIAPDPAALQRFFQLWTLKEAYLKASGTGMSVPLKALWFDPLSSPLRVTFREDHPDSAATWQFRVWRFSDAHWLSLAVAPTPPTDLHVTFYRVTPLRDCQPSPQPPCFCGRAPAA